MSDQNRLISDVKVLEAEGALSLFALNAGVYANSAAGLGGEGLLFVRSTGTVRAETTTTTAPQIVTAGAGNGFSPFLGILAGADVTGLYAECNLTICNAAGTERLEVHGSTLDPTACNTPDMTAWTVYNTVGSDLAVSGDGLTIDSTAGGAFIASVIWKLLPV